MYDAIVVGARCAGAPTAMRLATKGYKVLLLDRDVAASNMAHSTHLIHPEGVAWLMAWDLYDKIARRCSPFRTWTIDLHGVSLEGIPPATMGGVDISIAPRRDVLDGVLVEGACRAGAELRERFRVCDLIFNKGRVTGVRARNRNGSQFVEHAHIVVGADGPASTVARYAKAREYRAAPPLQSNIWSYWRGVSVDHLEIHIGPNQGAFAFPTSDGAVLVAANLSYDQFRLIQNKREHNYWAMLARAAPELHEKTRSAKRVDRFFAGCTRSFVRQAFGPGWALVGDAGMKKDPITAQGITVAFEYAEKLANAIDAGLSGQRLLEDALTEYARERDERLLPYYDFTLSLAALAAPSPEQLAVYHALQGDNAAISQFFGTISLSVPPEKFMVRRNETS
jgi:flavin-dependent dehydrogenase